MNKFFDYIQPTIIQATMNEELPERVRGRYFINFNVLGIEYFDEHYLLQETVFGAPYLISKESQDGYILLEDSPNQELIDIAKECFTKEKEVPDYIHNKFIDLFKKELDVGTYDKYGIRIYSIVSTEMLEKILDLPILVLL